MTNFICIYLPEWYTASEAFIIQGSGHFTHGANLVNVISLYLQSKSYN